MEEREIVRKDFDWNKIIKKYADVYDFVRK